MCHRLTLNMFTVVSFFCRPLMLTLLKFNCTHDKTCLFFLGLTDTPVSTYLRIPFWIFWIGSVTLYASYTGVLTSSLAVDTEKDRFSNLQEAMDDTSWTVGMLNGGYGTTQISVSWKEPLL